MAEVGALLRRFEIAADDHRRRSPFNARLCRAIAGRPDIAGILQAAREEQQLPVLLLAAVHSIVLAEPDVALADWYATAREAPRDDDPFPAFAQLCRDREHQLRTIVSTHSTQTNEVGRCALFVPALGLLADEVGTIGLVDVGTSAGLNLRLDHYRYEYDTGVSVGPASTVELPCGVRGSAPIPGDIPPIGARVGIDRSPIDVRDPEQMRWLMACVWPDQRDRFDRLAGAIEIATANPADVRTGDAVDLLADAVGDVAAGAHPTVMTSWVLNYLPLERRIEFVTELDRLGAERDQSWVLLESPGMCRGLPWPAEIAGSFLTHLVLVRWRHGRRSITHLAECHPHGYWLQWA